MTCGFGWCGVLLAFVFVVFPVVKHLLYSCFYVFYCFCCVLFFSRDLYSSVLQVVDPYVVLGSHPLDIFGLLAYYVWHHILGDLVCGRHVSAGSLRLLVVCLFCCVVCLVDVVFDVLGSISG